MKALAQLRSCVKFIISKSYAFSQYIIKKGYAPSLTIFLLGLCTIVYAASKTSEAIGFRIFNVAEEPLLLEIGHDCSEEIAVWVEVSAGPMGDNHGLGSTQRILWSLFGKSIPVADAQIELFFAANFNEREPYSLECNYVALKSGNEMYRSVTTDIFGGIWMRGDSEAPNINVLGLDLDLLTDYYDAIIFPQLQQRSQNILVQNDWFEFNSFMVKDAFTYQGNLHTSIVLQTRLGSWGIEMPPQHQVLLPRYFAFQPPIYFEYNYSVQTPLEQTDSGDLVDVNFHPSAGGRYVFERSAEPIEVSFRSVDTRRPQEGIIILWSALLGLGAGLLAESLILLLTRRER